MFDNKQGDSASFDTNWKNREESLHTHWTRGKVENQIQLAFKASLLFLLVSFLK